MAHPSLRGGWNLLSFALVFITVIFHTRLSQVQGRSESVFSICLSLRMCVCVSVCAYFQLTKDGIALTGVWICAIVSHLCVLGFIFWSQALCSSHMSSVCGISWVRILEQVATYFSRGFPTRDWILVFCIAGRFSTNWAAREAPSCLQPLKLTL